MAFPTTLTNVQDGITEILAAHINNIEEYVGIVGSLDTDTLTYKLTSTSSDEPGHTHSTKANDNAVVKLSGDQTVAGKKSFSTFPETPSSAPTTDYQTANKKYVDDGLASKSDTTHDHDADYVALPASPEELIEALTTLTVVGPSTPDYDIADLTNSSPYGFAGLEEGRTVLSIIKNLQDRVDKLEDIIVAAGLAEAYTP